MLLCLSCLCPGKTGSFIRKIATMFVALTVIYAVTWTLTVKNLKFNPQKSFLSKEQILTQTIQVSNNSYIPIELIDLDFYSSEDVKVDKTTEGLPTYIEGMSSESIKILTKFVPFQYVEICVKIMGLKKAFKQKIEANK